MMMSELEVQYCASLEPPLFFLGKWEIEALLKYNVKADFVQFFFLIIFYFWPFWIEKWSMTGKRRKREKGKHAAKGRGSDSKLGLPLSATQHVVARSSQWAKLVQIVIGHMLPVPHLSCEGARETLG